MWLNNGNDKIGELWKLKDLTELINEVEGMLAGIQGVWFVCFSLLMQVTPEQNINCSKISKINNRSTDVQCMCIVAEIQVWHRPIVLVYCP